MASDDADDPTDDDSEYSAEQVEDAYAAAVPGDIPPIDFNILVLSLNTSALIDLGEGPTGDGDGTGSKGAAVVNLPMARQTIDMLAILEEKTRGNLGGEEERIISQVLFDLRMRYVAKANS